MDEIERVIKKNKEKRSMYQMSNVSNKKSSKFCYLKGLISRILFAVIFVLASIIFTKSSENNKLLYKKYVLENSLEFTKINNLYEKYFGRVDLTKKKNDVSVSTETFSYISKEPFLDGEAFTMNKNEAIKAINGGIVVFIGDKDEYGKTIIVQGNDGVDIWYSNITDTNLKVYDYVGKDTILGSLESDKLVLTIQKDNEFITYEEYKKNI